ncbi:MAG: recombination mediator RecR [Gammaproteobacteria bacterium]|nr:recombination mediator RecR [Gammaproteobacteria bacterium]
MNSSPLLDQLIEAFRCLPGVGPKQAQRMTLHLLERNRKGADKLSQALKSAIEQVGNCRECRIFTEEDLCRICSSESRNKTLCCVVESPADVYAIEQSGTYSGVYFVLMGHLSPIDGIGPEQIGIPQLIDKVNTQSIQEIIIACNPSAEGNATAYYIAEQCRDMDVVVSRIAHGVPVGGELVYVDGNTLSHAINGRKVMEQIN